MNDKKNVKVHYGCWKDAPDDWSNFDCSPYLLLDRIPFIGTFICSRLQPDWERFPNNIRYGDITKGLPVEDASCDMVYCSHVLEHLNLTDFRIALKNTYKILKEDGVFRLVLPDLEYYIKSYLSENTTGASMRFMQDTGLGEVSRENLFIESMRFLLGGSKHKWMWDYESLKLELKNAGFEHIRRAYIGDSALCDFNQVEKVYRWDKALGIECQKTSN